MKIDGTCRDDCIHNHCWSSFRTSFKGGTSALVHLECQRSLMYLALNYHPFTLSQQRFISPLSPNALRHPFRAVRQFLYAKSRMGQVTCNHWRTRNIVAPTISMFCASEEEPWFKNSPALQLAPKLITFVVNIFIPRVAQQLQFPKQGQRKAENI